MKISNMEIKYLAKITNSLYETQMNDNIKPLVGVFKKF